MLPIFTGVTLYTRCIPEMVDFYSRHFGYAAFQRPGDRIVDLRPLGAGTAIRLHLATKGQKQGQVLVKLNFDVDNVSAFAHSAKERGLVFGPLHDGMGYVNANAKDPSGNSISISGRTSAAAQAAEFDVPYAPGQ
ncbi:VOC family protein [Aestuariivirga sp.]|uniref:VOC family protein n=1 Tax=Aestuariivirga sp. TaxID=2650926 RepID=UPI003BAD3D8C